MARKSSTVTNITDALRCAKKVAQGKPCSMKELKSSVMLLHTAYKQRGASLRQQLKQIGFLENFVNNMR